MSTGARPRGAAESSDGQGAGIQVVAEALLARGQASVWAGVLPLTAPALEAGIAEVGRMR